MTATPPSLQHLQALHADIEALCRRHGVRRLDLFGSAALGEAGAGSDYDFLVEFEPFPSGGYADAYFGLLEDMQDLLGTPVELVAEHAIRNPYFLQAVQAQRAPLYVA